MSTISNLFVNVTMRAAGFGAASRVMSNQMLHVAGSSNIAKQSLRETAGEAAGAAAMFDRATRSARGYLRVASGGAIGGITLARAIKAGAQQEAADNAQRRAAGNTDSLIGVSEAWRKLAESVNDAFGAFGRAFNESAGVKDLVLMAAGAVQKLIPLLSLAGRAAGAVAGWFSRLGVAIVPVIVVVKLLGFAIGALGTVITYVAMAGLTRFLLAQTELGRAILAVIARISLKTAAMWLLTTATTAAASAAALLKAVSWPVWMAITAAVAVAAAAIWLFWKAIQAILSPFQRLWAWLTTPAKADNAIAVTAEQLDEARKSVQQLKDQMQGSIDTFGMTESQKQLYEFQKALKKLPPEEHALEIAAFKAQQAQLRGIQQVSAAIDRQIAKMGSWISKQKELAGSLYELAKAAKQAGMSENEKQLDNLAEKGAGPAMLAVANHFLMLADQRTKAAEQAKKAEEQLADIRREAEQSDMTEMEKRIANYKLLGASEKQLAEFRQHAAKLEADKRATEAAEAAKKWRSDMAQRAEAIRKGMETPLDKHRNQLLEITKALASGNLNPVDAMKAADAAQKSFAESMGDSMAKVASPQALLKGSAEAALAQNLAKNPAERQTELQKQQVAEAKQLNANFTVLADAIKRGQSILATITGS